MKSKWQDWSFSQGVAEVLRAVKIVQGGRTGVVVAASNSKEEYKALADFVCDGIDDDIEIKQALQASNFVTLLDGEYIVNTQDNGDILIPSYTMFQGQGFGTIIKNRDGVDLSDNFAVLTVPKTSNFTIVKNLTLDGNKENGIGSGANAECIDFDGNHSVLTNVRLKNAGSEGLDIDDGKNQYISNIFVQNCRNSGVRISNEATLAPENINLNNILIDNCGHERQSFALRCGSVKADNIVIKNHAGGVGTGGAFVVLGSRDTMKFGKVEIFNSGNKGVFIDETNELANITFESVIVDGVSDIGLELRKCKNVHIDNAIISGSGANSLKVDSGNVSIDNIIINGIENPSVSNEVDIGTSESVNIESGAIESYVACIRVRTGAEYFCSGKALKYKRLTNGGVALFESAMADVSSRFVATDTSTISNVEVQLGKIHFSGKVKNGSNGILVLPNAMDGCTVSGADVQGASTSVSFRSNKGIVTGNVLSGVMDVRGDDNIITSNQYASLSDTGNDNVIVNNVE